MDDVLDLSGEQAQPVRPRARDYVALLGHAIANAADIALLVTGTALIALAAAVVIDGFDFATLNLTDGTGAMFGSAMVIGVFGAFALGVAAEGPIGHRSYDWRYSGGPVIMARMVAVLAISLLMFLLGGYLPDILDGLPFVFEFVIEIVRNVGLAGMTFVLLIGVPAAAGLRYFYGGEPWVEELELPLLYAVWVIATMVLMG